ncbi:MULTISPECIES: CocE/NonD family hydrolase [unclassified Pseudomonas]|uniref:CocE/NonD family hydrolase n=1 Tax=unclassified Pseudomonas TaxID=196821 RepID=UPI00131B841B
MGRLSELNKFEGIDPAFWVNRGYVVLQPDSRGAYKSEGNLVYWGTQLGEDGYDFVEWAADQNWSNGKIGMAGNRPCRYSTRHCPTQDAS